jgi:AraC-like DNA-binding protein
MNEIEDCEHGERVESEEMSLSKHGLTREDATRQFEADRETVARTISLRTKGSEDRPSPIADLAFFRREAPTPPGVCLVEPSLILVVQGVKRMLVGENALAYDSERFLIASHDIPASSEVIEASPERPCLGLVFRLDLRVISELVTQIDLPSPKMSSATLGIAIGTVTPVLLESIRRLTDLLDEPDAIEALSPLANREIHYRLLTSDQGCRLRHLASVGSQGQLIARAIDWLKANYASPLRIEDLAKRVHMSASTFHSHFRHLTAMSPLQYQKWLRLNEARRLMLNEGFDATSAAFQVGYESPSQFSREYARLFGAPPRSDIASLRVKAASSAALSN